jgi:hypothetical protein
MSGLKFSLPIDVNAANRALYHSFQNLDVKLLAICLLYVGRKAKSATAKVAAWRLMIKLLH